MAAIAARSGLESGAYIAARAVGSMKTNLEKVKLYSVQAKLCVNGSYNRHST